MNVMQQTDALIEAIETSSEFAQYHLLQKTIMKEDVYNRLNEFRRRNFEIQMNPQVDAINSSANLYQEYADILNRTEVKEFLNAEQRFIRMLRKIHEEIDKHANINVDFL
ncbi:MAG: YlbF family regulator [Clostridiales bacterium]|nr:YlbF family regulator [Clostridiales bacterium]MDE7422932.1 YlbF family regulator [Lachnospiraceae bacterium]